MKILLIDDEIFTSEVIKSLVNSLHKMNHELDFAYKISSAIDRIEKVEYDVIILDIMMPYNDNSYSFNETEGGIKTGYIFLKDFLIERKHGERNVNKPVIIFTNLSDFENEFYIQFKHLITDETLKNVFIVNKPFFWGVIEIINNIKNEKIY